MFKYLSTYHYRNIKQIIYINIYVWHLSMLLTFPHYGMGSSTLQETMQATEIFQQDGVL